MYDFEQRLVLTSSTREEALKAILRWLASRNPITLTVKRNDKDEFQIEAINSEMGITY